MGLFKDAPPTPHPEFTQLRIMTAGSPSWWKQNRHKVLAVAGLLTGFWLAGHHEQAPRACTPPAAGTAAPSAAQPSSPASAASSASVSCN